jgi:hypothetical protein
MKLKAVFRKLPEGTAAFVEEHSGADNQGETLDGAARKESYERGEMHDMRGKRIEAKSHIPGLISHHSCWSLQAAEERTKGEFSHRTSELTENNLLCV